MGILYETRCLECNGDGKKGAVYVGESARSGSERMSEHLNSKNMFNRCSIPRISEKDTKEEVNLDDREADDQDLGQEEGLVGDGLTLSKSKKEMRHDRLRDLVRWGEASNEDDGDLMM